MKALNFDWCKKEWVHFENGKIVLNDDAPEEAKEEYIKYLKQINGDTSAI